MRLRRQRMCISSPWSSWTNLRKSRRLKRMKNPCLKCKERKKENDGWMEGGSVAVSGWMDDVNKYKPPSISPPVLPLKFIGEPSCFVLTRTVRSGRKGEPATLSCSSTRLPLRRASLCAETRLTRFVQTTIVNTCLWCETWTAWLDADVSSLGCYSLTLLP